MKNLVITWNNGDKQTILLYEDEFNKFVESAPFGRGFESWVINFKNGAFNMKYAREICFEDLKEIG